MVVTTQNAGANVDLSKHAMCLAARPEKVQQRHDMSIVDLLSKVYGCLGMCQAKHATLFFSLTGMVQAM